MAVKLLIHTGITESEAKGKYLVLETEHKMLRCGKDEYFGFFHYIFFPLQWSTAKLTYKYFKTAAHQEKGTNSVL